MTAKMSLKSKLVSFIFKVPGWPRIVFELFLIKVVKPFFEFKKKENEIREKNKIEKFDPLEKAPADNALDEFNELYDPIKPVHSKGKVETK